MTRQSVSTTAAGIVGCSHAARPDCVHVVGHGRGQPRVDLVVGVRARRSASRAPPTPSLIAVTAGLRTTSIIRRTQSRSRHAVAIVGQHVELHDRIDPGVIRAQANLAGREHAHDRAHQPAARERLVGRPDRAEPDHLHVVRPRVGQARRVAQHRAEDRRVRRRHPSRRAATRSRSPMSRRAPSGSRRPGGRRRVRCPTAAGSPVNGSHPRRRSPLAPRSRHPCRPHARSLAVPSNEIRSTSTSPRTSRFGRGRAGSR